LIDNADGAIIVSTPQDLSVQDVRRSIMFCRHLNLPVTGVIENMSGFVCPHCHKPVDIFKTGGGERMAQDMEVPFLGKIPIDPMVVESGDSGQPVVQGHDHSETCMAFGRIVRKLLEPDFEAAEQRPLEQAEGESLRIAVPVAQGALCLHFGHCEQFAVFDTDPDTKSIQEKQLLTPPPHEPGVLPRWLHEQGAQVVIAGGMGARAQSLFTQNGILVVVGAPSENPEQVVTDYLCGKLKTGVNMCDH